MKIALIDDHKLLTETICKSLPLILTEIEEIELYNAPHKLLEKISGKTPDIIISDFLMPSMNGMELWQQIKDRYAQTRFLLLTSVNDLQTVKAALRSGIMGYVSKESPFECLVEGILELRDHNQYLCPLTRKLFVSHVLADDKIVYRLSPRETEILTFLCSGKTVKEIAFDLQLGLSTIQTYVKNLMRKFKVNRTVDLILFATQNRLI